MKAITFEQVVFLGDILSTGYVCAANAGIRPGDTVAVMGGIPVNLDTGDPVAELRRRTGGRGPDAVLERVGHTVPFAHAMQAVRPGGTASSEGVYVDVMLEPSPARSELHRGELGRVHVGKR